MRRLTFTRLMLAICVVPLTVASADAGCRGRPLQRVRALFGGGQQQCGQQRQFAGPAGCQAASCPAFTPAATFAPAGYLPTATVTPAGYQAPKCTSAGCGR